MSRDILSEIDTSGEIAIWVAVTINAVLTRADNRLNGQGDARHWIDDADNGFFEAVADDAGFSAERLRQRIWDELARSAGARSVFAQRRGCGNVSGMSWPGVPAHVLFLLSGSNVSRRGMEDRAQG